MPRFPLTVGSIIVRGMDSLKRQVLPGQLAVVATPIGNLDDLSPRARQVLSEADIILCEDTRRTAKLVAGVGIDRSLSTLHRFDAHSSPSKADAWVERLLSGESIALVTDAGTPGISDPGALLVARAREAGVSIFPVPGPSAVAALLSVAGFEDTSFGFRGFFPRKDAEQERELALLAESGGAKVWAWFESPERVSKSITKIGQLRPKDRIVVGKELTKLHEKVFCGPAEEISIQIKQELENSGTRGEWCLAIQFSSGPGGDNTAESGALAGNSSDWVKALLCLRDAGVAASESVRHVARHFDVPRNTVYESAVNIFQKKS